MWGLISSSMCISGWGSVFCLAFLDVAGVPLGHSTSCSGWFVALVRRAILWSGCVRFVGRLVLCVLFGFDGASFCSFCLCSGEAVYIWVVVGLGLPGFFAHLGCYLLFGVLLAGFGLLSLLAIAFLLTLFDGSFIGFYNCTYQYCGSCFKEDVDLGSILSPWGVVRRLGMSCL